MTSKTFKSDNELAKTISITRSQGRVLVEIEDPKHLIAINLSDNNAPALALAILEAAGYTEDDTEIGPRKNLVTTDYSLGMRYLRFGIEDQEHKAQANKAAEAKEQAELEAEALKLFNASLASCGLGQVELFDALNPLEQQRWLTVARKARELRAEK